MLLSKGSTLTAADDLNWALTTDDKYDYDESFVGEYGVATSNKKFDELI